MSLTSLLRDNPEIKKIVPNLKASIVHLDGTPWTPSDWKTEILVPSIGGLRVAGLMGTAFDYLARSVLTRLHPEAMVWRRVVAEEGLALLPSMLRAQRADLVFHPNPEIQAQRRATIDLLLPRQQEMTQYLDARLRAGVDALQHPSMHNIRTLARHSLLLARLDATYRDGAVPAVDEYLATLPGTPRLYTLPVPEDEIIENLVAMAELFEQRIASMPMRHILLNPEFGRYSRILGGADADLIFDDTLIDLKSTVKLGYSSGEIAQILAYSAMAVQTGIPIKRAGLYFARYGLFAVINLQSIDPYTLENLLGTLMAFAG